MNKDPSIQLNDEDTPWLRPVNKDPSIQLYDEDISEDYEKLSATQLVRFLVMTVGINSLT